MPTGGMLRVQRNEFVTRDRDEASGFITETFVRHRPHLGKDTPRAEFRVRLATAGPVETAVSHLTMPFETSTDSFGYLMPLQVVGGGLDIAGGGEHHRLGRGDVVMPPPHVPVTVSWNEVRTGLLRLSLERVAEHAGMDAGALRFTSMAPVSTAMARYWRSTLAMISRELMAPDSVLAHPLVTEQMLRLAATAILHTFPNRTMVGDHAREPGRVAPATLRRAVAYLDAHADRPVTMAGIAAAAGIGPRALQSAFRRHYDLTPIEYLRRVRLEHAHCELQEADPTRGDTVAAIAARWGFAKPGRFAALYRQAYGRLPSETLRA